MFATRHVVIADWLLTTPAVIFQFFSGWRLMFLAGYHFSEAWIFAAILLYLFAGVCWLPVVWIQIKMRDMALIAQAQNENLSEKFWAYDRW